MTPVAVEWKASPSF
jgi:hypothetical protein